MSKPSRSRDDPIARFISLPSPSLNRGSKILFGRTRERERWINDTDVVGSEFSWKRRLGSRIRHRSLGNHNASPGPGVGFSNCAGWKAVLGCQKDGRVGESISHYAHIPRNTRTPLWEIKGKILSPSPSSWLLITGLRWKHILYFVIFSKWRLPIMLEATLCPVIENEYFWLTSFLIW